MSGSDDPFGRSERTVIRPNPGGRLPQTPAAPKGAGRSRRSAHGLAENRQNTIYSGAAASVNGPIDLR